MREYVVTSVKATGAPAAIKSVQFAAKGEDMTMLGDAVEGWSVCGLWNGQ